MSAGRDDSTSDRSSGQPEAFEVVIRPHVGWRAVDLGEIVQHRDLLYHLVWKNVRSRFVQSVFGLGWTLIQPITTMLIYTIVFSRVARIEVPGDVPYPLFAFCGIVPWTFFSGSLSAVSNSLISNVATLSKVYFPRLILPIAEVLTRFVDLLIIAVVLGVLLLGYGYIPRPEAVVVVPLAILIAATAALGLGLWLSVLALQYRDVAYGLAFIVQIMMYLSPVIYASETIFEALGPTRAYIWGLNPMVGVISAFRWSLLGMGELNIGLVTEASLVAVTLLVTGALYFRRSERFFADVS